MTLDDILKMWAEDIKIDEVNLDVTSMKSAQLHSKYLELYSLSKLQFKKGELGMAVLKKDKWLYYNGKMSKEDMDSRGWNYDPFAGMAKPLKSDMDLFYETDADISKLRMKLDYQQVIVDSLKDILDNIKWRHSHIKNILDFRRFTAGV
jgi:hypothetical protein